MRRISIKLILQLVALVFVVSLSWALARDRVSLQNWQIPPEYSSDALEFITWIKSASEGDFIPFFREGSHRLGAPYTADWADYPAAEKFLIFFLGMVAKGIGLYPACNFGPIFVYLLSAISFFQCCRLLKYSPTWSFVGAALFALTYYNTFRNLGNLHLACSYTIPFGLLTGWLVLASKRIQVGDRFSWICFLTALVMGMGGPYNLNMFLQFIVFGLVVQFLTHKRKENLRIGLICIAIAGAAFLAINARSLLYERVHGKNTYALARHYFEAELYALKPIELIIPPANHHVAALADIGERYRFLSFVKGEMFSAYLGVIVAAVVVWIFVEAFLGIIGRKHLPRRFPAYSLQIAWIIAYACIAGMNCIIALSGFQLFRATDRYSIYISAIALLFLVCKMTRLSRDWSPGVKYGVAAAVLSIGLFDQLPGRLPADQVGFIERKIASDRAYGQKMEEKLPAGSVVFQLPAMLFPEAPTINGVEGYEMLRPYLYTKTLRFSYGAIRGRPREDWQWDVEKMPGPQMVGELEKYGFGAIHLERRCYQDGGESVLKQLAEAGRTNLIEDDLHDQVCVLLNPSPHPELPHTDDRALLVFKHGWTINEHAPAENRVWSGGDATVAFFSESKQVTSYAITGLVGSISARRVTISMKGKQIWAADIPAGQAAPVNLVVAAWHGYNTLEIETDRPPVRPSDSSPPLAFTLVKFEVTRTN